MNSDPLRVPLGPTPVSPLLASWTRALPMGLALVGTAAAWLLVDLLAPTDGRLTEILLRRGWIPPLTLALFFWGLGHALRRLLVQRGEVEALEWCRHLLDEHDLRHDLRPHRIPTFLGALHPLKQSLAGPVMESVLSYFQGQRPARDEVVKVAGQAVDRAFDRVESEYKALSACMWLLPLTGFLGTVVGMAAAIASFDGVLDAAGRDLGALAPAMSGLATAFDTTLLALALVLPLKLIEVGLEGRDRRLLDRIDASVGAGWVRHLDLAVLAQARPEEIAAERVAARLERIEASLRTVDAALERVAGQVAALPEAGAMVQEVIGAARACNVWLPALAGRLDDLREQADQPMVVTRSRRSS